MTESSTALDGLAGDGAVIGVDLGGTKLAAALFDPAGRQVRALTVPVAGLPTDELLDALVGAVNDLAGASDDPVVAGGYGIPSTIDQRTGSAITAANLPLKDVPLRDILVERTGVPAFLDNDANVAALAEQRAGSGAGITQDLLMVTLGTGFGGGIIDGGRIIRGSIGAGAELGHVPLDWQGDPCNSPGCTSRGCVENYVCGTALGRQLEAFVVERPDSPLARLVAGGEPPRGELVTRMALQGDRDSIRLLERQGEALGAALAGFVNIFNPRIVAVGGGLTPALPFILPVAERVLRERAFSPGNTYVELVPAAFGAEAGIIGAAMLARLELELAAGSRPAGATHA